MRWFTSRIDYQPRSSYPGRFNDYAVHMGELGKPYRRSDPVLQTCRGLRQLLAPLLGSFLLRRIEIFSFREAVDQAGTGNLGGVSKTSSDLRCRTYRFPNTNYPNEPRTSPAGFRLSDQIGYICKTKVDKAQHFLGKRTHAKAVMACSSSPAGMERLFGKMVWCAYDED